MWMKGARFLLCLRVLTATLAISALGMVLSGIYPESAAAAASPPAVNVINSITFIRPSNQTGGNTDAQVTEPYACGFGSQTYVWWLNGDGLVTVVAYGVTTTGTPVSSYPDYYDCTITACVLSDVATPTPNVEVVAIVISTSSSTLQPLISGCGAGP